MQTRWTNFHRQILIDAMLNEASRGTLTGRGFRKASWRRIHAEFSARTRDELKCSNQHLQTQFSELKKKYFLFKELQETEGFTFDPIKCQLFASPEVWKAEIIKNSITRRFQNRPMPFYRELESMFSGAIVGKRKVVDYTYISTAALNSAAAAADAIGYESKVQIKEPSIVAKPDLNEIPLLLSNLSSLSQQSLDTLSVMPSPAFSNLLGQTSTSAAAAAGAALALPAPQIQSPPALSMRPELSMGLGFGTYPFTANLQSDAMNSGMPTTQPFAPFAGPLHLLAPPLPMYGMYNINPGALLGAQGFPFIDQQLLDNFCAVNNCLNPFLGQSLNYSQMPNSQYFGFPSS
jgi:hypothetical protein